MDNRETLTPSSGDAILKRHLFSEVARNWIKARGHIGRAYFVRRPSRQSFGFRVEWPLRAAQFLKPPALPGDTYALAGRLQARRTLAYFSPRWTTRRRFDPGSSPSASKSSILQR